MASLDRAGMIELLDRLGAEDEQAVLEAARELDRKVSDSGLTWDDLLRAQFDAAAAESEDAPLTESPADDEPVPAKAQASAADNAEAARLIERLLARKNLSSTLREDLAEFKRSIADGSFDSADSRYLRALAKRLGA